MSKIIENYVLDTILGAGQFGKVFKAKNTKDNNYYAIKSIKRQIFDDNPKLKEFTVNEIHTLTKINNEHVVKFIEMIKTNNNFYFVYEFCNGGTLEEDLYSRGYFTEKEAKPIFQQIVKGLDSVIKLNIIHRDLKPQNVLYHNGKIKIADFGFCKPMQSKNQLTKTVLGSPIYMAPEILRGDDYTMKADIWSLGVMFYEMLFGKCPYEGKSIASLISLIEDTPLIFDEIHPISDTMKKLLKEMLCKDSKKRIEWEKLYDIVMEKSVAPRIDFKNNNDYNEKEVLSFQEPKKKVSTLTVNISQPSPKKIESQALSLDNTPSIELNPASFNQTIINLKTDQNFSKPFSQNEKSPNKTEKNSSNSHFMKGHTFMVSNDPIPKFGEEINKTSKNENNPIIKNRDSLHSSFHKTEKSELNFYKIYKIEIKKVIYSSESLLKFLAKERNKILFLSKVFHDISFYKLMSPIEIFEVYFHKFLYFHAKNFKEMLLDHVSLDVIKIIGNYNDLCNCYEYKVMKELLKEEMDKIMKTFILHKEKTTLVTGIDKIDLDALNNINLKIFFKFVLDYISLVKENFLFSKDEKFRSEDYVKYMVHAIEIIDCLMLNELFDNFMDEDISLENQKYLLMLQNTKFVGLLKILNHKIDYFKKKYYQD